MRNRSKLCQPDPSPLQVRHTRNHRRYHWHPGAVNSASSRRRSSVSWQVHQADLGALTVSAETPPPRPLRRDRDDIKIGRDKSKFGRENAKFDRDGRKIG